MNPDETATGLAQRTPQAVLVEALCELRPSMLSDDGRINVAVALERHIGMLPAQLTQTLAVLEAGSTEDGFTRDAGC